LIILKSFKYHANNNSGNDICGQLYWLKVNLNDARINKYRVIITGHVPPGYFERKPDRPFFQVSYFTTIVL